VNARPSDRWARTTFGRLARIRNGADYSSVEVEAGGYPVFGSGGEFRRASTFLFDGESVLFGRKGTVDRPLYVSGKFWTVDTMFYSVIDKSRLIPRFAYYWATTLPFGEWATDTALPSMTSTALKAAPIALPSVPEQRAIADYLDRETAQIDAFITKNEELITLLTERRSAAAQSEVEHHVGEGSRLKFRLREIDVRAGDEWAALPLLSVSIHNGVVPRGTYADPSNESSDLSHYKVAQSRDIVLNRMRAFQGGLGVSPCAGLVSPDYAVLRPTDDVDADWLALVMRTPRFVGEMARRLRGIGSANSGAVRTPRISVGDLGAILVDFPSSAQQTAELRAVSNSAERIEDAISVAQRSVSLARERRAALISATVTGKINVGVAT
jgi:type I restriction enzyme S subunit